MGPLLSTLIKQYFPQKAASIIGVYSFGMGVGSAISAGLTVVILKKTESYLFALSIWAILAIVAIIVWFITSRQIIQQPKNQSVKINREEIGKSPWKTKKSWLFLIFFGLQSAVFFSILTWLVPIATFFGMTLLQAGALLTAMTTVQIFLNILIPLLVEKYPARKNWLFFIIGSGIVAMLLFLTGKVSLMWIGAILMGIPLGGLFPMALLLPLDETKSASEASRWTAMMQTGGFIIGGTLPLIIAIVYDRTHDHHYTILLILTLFLLLILLTIFIGNKDNGK